MTLPVRSTASAAEAPRTFASSSIDLLEVSIVMPCLNEEASVGACVLQARDWLDKAGVRGEVVIADNGSDDASVQEALAAGARVVFEARRGYGSALRQGIASARGRFVIMGDCDRTYDYSALDPILEALRDGADLVVGNRYAGGIERGSMTWSHRYIGTPVLTLLVRLFSGARLGDSQCGLRGFSRAAYDRLDLNSDGMEFASEMILKAARLRIDVREVPIRYLPRTGAAKLETFRDGWRHLRFLLLATPNALYTAPGLLMLGAGAAILALALTSRAGELALGPVRWHPLYAGSILFVIGLNALFLAGVAHLYTAERSMTQPRGAVYRASASVFRFERVIAGVSLLLALAVGLEVWLAMGVAPADQAARTALAAIGQALVLSAGNFGLAGFLASLIRGADRSRP